MSAVISDCGKYRYRLDRDCGLPFEGAKVIAYFGINPSTADEQLNDNTVRKWIGFTQRNGGHHFIVGNVFSLRSKDVDDLAPAKDSAIGPLHWEYIDQIISEADVLVPCWGVTAKVPPGMHGSFDRLLAMLHGSGKPVLHFGKTKGGDPLHVLTLAYATPLIPLAKA